MSNLSEKVVQETAQAFLYHRYRKKARGGKIFSKMEARTRREYGGKRADGLLAFQHYIWGAYAVSMEAKSFKTLAAMKPTRNDNLLLWNSFKAGLICCIMSGMFFAIYRLNDGFMQILLPLNTLVCAAIIYGFFTSNSYRHKTVNVIRQLAQYPANERWLAFSGDSLKLLSKDQLYKLDKICKYKGIGIVIVNKKDRAEVYRSASMQWKWFGDFIKYYSSEKRIREIIG
ncbi:MAG: hypothetical protein ACI81W_002037 [Saprospiraceae bacterium]|jgi:hypothetical protein